MDHRTTARAAVDLCTRAFNAHEPLPDRVNVGGRMLATGPFLRNLVLSSATGDECTPTFQRDTTGAQPVQLGPQALQLAEAAEREGLLAPAPAVPVASDPLMRFRAAQYGDPVKALHALGISADYVKPREDRPLAPAPRRVTHEPHPWDPATHRRDTAEAIALAAQPPSDPVKLAETAAQAAADAEARRLHVESMGSRSPFAQPAPAPSGMFGSAERSTFRDQTGGEPAKVAEPPAKRERRAEA